MNEAEVNITNYDPAFRFGIPLPVRLLDSTGATAGQAPTFDGNAVGWGFPDGLFNLLNGDSIASGSIGAGVGATNAHDSVFIGTNAGVDAVNASGSFFFGEDAGNGATNATNSIFIGTRAGQDAISAAYATFVGLDAGNAAFNAQNGVFIGYGSGFEAEEAVDSVFIGYQSGYQATNARQSFFLGYTAGSGADNARSSIFIGNAAGFNDTVNNSLSDSSILIGNETSTGGFSNSIAIGKGATNTKSGQLLIAAAYTPTVTLAEYADNAAAIGGGLTAGDLYKTTGGGSSIVKVVT